VAGLPLLALYTAPVSILNNGVPWWVFAVGATSFLALLATDEGHRLTSWGRRVPRGETLFDSGAGNVSTASIRSSARKIGLTATGLALVAPVIIPTLSGSILAGGGPGGDGDGDAVTISNPLVNLRRDLVRGRDVDLLTITTENANPSYLRISVLDIFNGDTWKPSDRDIPVEQRAEGALPRPPGLDSWIPRKQVDYEIRVEDDFGSTWLPAPYPVTTIDVPGDWRYDTDTLDFISAVDDQTTEGLEYSLSALEVDPDDADLVTAGATPEAIFTPNTELPDDLPDTVAQMAREVTAGLGSRFEKADRLQDWFREDGGFEYSLRRSESGSGADDLLAFLSTGPGGRVGYCEQFAASMALMGRTLGIPSRVAVGFLEPEKVGENQYVYSSHDLHAWPEMYFDGAGWLRFEPTPGDRASSIPGYTAGEFSAPEPTALPSVSAPTVRPEDIQRERREAEAAATPTGGGGSGGKTTFTGLLIGLAVAALLLAPRLARAAVRRRRWANARTAPEVAEAGWRELRDAALDLRLSWDDSVTLRTRARALVASFGRPGTEERDGHVRGGLRGAKANPEAAQALERLVRDVELARYARDSSVMNGRAADEVAADADTCAEALGAGASKKRRRLATWLPASLVRNGAWRSLWPGRPSAGVALAEAGVDRAN
jgi:transglutaminase-like putative cysteine protease